MNKKKGLAPTLMDKYVSKVTDIPGLSCIPKALPNIGGLNKILNGDVKGFGVYTESLKLLRL